MVNKLNWIELNWIELFKLSCKLEVKCEFREFQICTFVIFCSVLRRNWKKVSKSLEKSQRCRSQNSKVSDLHVVLVYLSKERKKPKNKEFIFQFPKTNIEEQYAQFIDDFLFQMENCRGLESFSLRNSMMHPRPSQAWMQSLSLVCYMYNAF